MPKETTDSLIDSHVSNAPSGTPPSVDALSPESALDAATASAGHILIVDDEAANRDTLRHDLGSAGYHVTEATNGFEALEILMALAQTETPIDLVMLDIMMPRMSGFEVCRTLRKQFGPDSLPVVFLTARHQGEDAIACFRAGANDYLSKPFSRAEMLARVKVHLGLLHSHRDLVGQHKRMRAMQAQLIHQEKMAGLGLLSAGIAHEINNPNSFLAVSAQTVETKLRELKQFIHELMGEDTDPEITTAFETRFNALFKPLALVKEGSERIAAIVRGMRSASRNDAHLVAPFDPVDSLLSTLELIKPSFRTVANFDTTDLQKGQQVRGFASQLSQVFMNLIVNSCHAIEEKQRRQGTTAPGEIRLFSVCSSDTLVIGIQDNGCGMSDAVKAKLFHPFFTTKSHERGTGLGLGICKGIVGEHGGQIEVESEEGVGTVFRIILPLNSEDAKEQS